MIQLLILTALSSFGAQGLEARSIQPCVWPNVCRQEILAGIQPCVWPNKCSKENTEARSIQPCVWPNLCKADS